MLFQPLSEILHRNMAIAIKNTAAPDNKAAPATPLPAAASLIEEVSDEALFTLNSVFTSADSDYDSDSNLIPVLGS